jgi:hypothetical protein
MRIEIRPLGRLAVVTAVRLRGARVELVQDTIAIVVPRMTEEDVEAFQRRRYQGE